MSELVNVRRKGERKRESNLPFQVMVFENICQFLCEVLIQKRSVENIHQKILKYRDHQQFGEQKFKVVC